MSARTRSVRPAGRPRDTNSQDTERAIRDAALHLFAEVGYGGTTNRAIAERAGVSAGTIYYHFESKCDVFVAVLHDTRRRIRQHLLGSAGDAGTLATRLEGILSAALELHGAEPALARFEASAAIDMLRHPELAAAVAPQLDDSRTVLLGLVADARRNGELTDGVDDDAVADAITALLTGLAQLALHTDRPRLDNAFQASTQLLAGRLLDEGPSR